MEITSKFITPGLVYLLTLVIGLWLSHLGKPYNGILFNAHKLIALGTVIVTGLQAYKAIHTIDIEALFVVLVVITGILYFVLFATGAFMSLGKPVYKTLLIIHRVSSIATTTAIVVMIYLLSRSSP